VQKHQQLKKNILELLGKPGLENINGDEVVAYGAALAGNFIKNLKDLKI
jgi:molecular chaperone DnaK (HSP70)